MVLKLQYYQKEVIVTGLQPVGPKMPGPGTAVYVIAQVSSK